MNSSIRKAGIFLAPFIAIPVLALATAVTEVWSEHCTRCHGVDGTGNTKVGKKLKVKDYSSATVQAQMTDEEIEAAIRDGVYDQNKKETMPGYKEKLSEKEMKDLVAYVRSFKK